MTPNSWSPDPLALSGGCRGEPLVPNDQMYVIDAPYPEVRCRSNLFAVLFSSWI